MGALFVCFFVAQPISAHQAALEGLIDDSDQGSPEREALPPPAEDGRIKTGVVYGYFPSHYGIDKIKGWNQLTHLVWFGPTVNSNGTLASSGGLGNPTYQAVRVETRKRGIKLLIGLVKMNDIGTLLANKSTVVQTAVKVVTQYDADGVSLDFEFVPESAKQTYVDCLRETRDALRAINPELHVSSAIVPPFAWYKGYDFVGILEASDLTFVMAYDYHWSTAPNAGPVIPKNPNTMWGINLTTSLDEFLPIVGDLKSKLVIGLPWYGYCWPTESTNLKAKVVARPEAPTFAPTFASGRSRIAAGQYDDASEQPYAVYSDAYGPRQMWLDNAASFASKMDLIKARGFAGVGMFQIGYEGDMPEVWDAISERYSEAPGAVVTMSPAMAPSGSPSPTGKTDKADGEMDAPSKQADGVSFGSQSGTSGGGCNTAGAPWLLPFLLVAFRRARRPLS